MYLSPAVRTMRDDPTPGVETTLLVRVDEEADPTPALEVVRDSEGEVTKETQFNNLHVVLPETAVANLLEGFPSVVEAVETVTSELSGDAGEDIDPDDVGDVGDV